jgi:hypothetical protein
MASATAPSAPAVVSDGLLARATAGLVPYAPPILRVVVGFIYVVYGYNKIQNPAGFEGMLTGLGRHVARGLRHRAAGDNERADHAGVLSALGTGSRAYATSSSRPMLRPSSLARACSAGPINDRASPTGSPR